LADWNVNNLKILLQAARFAAEKHAGQLRKGAHAEPYINHPLEVADLIANVGLVDDIDILMAGLLHDTIEDCGVEAEEVTARFGERACGFVLEVTDDKDLPKARRKELQVEHAPHKTQGAKIVKLADKISNCRDVLDNPAVDWSEERRRDYIAWGLQVVNGMRGANEHLEAKFDEIVARAESEFGVTIIS
jgi:guanosine-3',5'-bis(diphosphate) 3'-pyrophosphohydrolase